MTSYDEQPPAAVTSVELEASDAVATRALGKRLARVLRAGDLVILSGDLGAGKTTLTQGIGAGLGVRGDVTSPTFVISRVHPSLAAGPALVHVDAYRLHGGAELDDLDLDETLEVAVTVVEWGEGLADVLAADRLRIHLTRRLGGAVTHRDGDSADEDGDEPRLISVQGFGHRWKGVRLDEVLAAG